MQRFHGSSWGLSRQSCLSWTASRRADFPAQKHSFRHCLKERKRRVAEQNHHRTRRTRRRTRLRASNAARSDLKRERDTDFTQPLTYPSTDLKREIRASEIGYYFYTVNSNPMSTANPSMGATPSVPGDSVFGGMPWTAMTIIFVCL